MNLNLDDYSDETLEVIEADLLSLLDCDVDASRDEIRRFADEITDELAARDGSRIEKMLGEVEDE